MGTHIRSFEWYHPRPPTTSSSPRLGVRTPPKTPIAITSGTDKATNFKFGQNNNSVHPNNSPWNILEQRKRGRIQGLPKFFGYPLLSSRLDTNAWTNVSVAFADRDRITGRSCRNCGYHQLRQLRPVIRSLSAKATETLVHAFVSSRLDYCNSLLMASPTGYTVAFSPSRTQPRDLCVVSGVHIFFIHRDVCHISN